MNPNDLRFHTVKSLSQAIREGNLSSIEVTEAYLRRVEKIDPSLNSYITILEKGALKAATDADRQITQGKYRGPLHGIPIAIKDLFETRGIRTTCGSRLLAGHVSSRDATVVEKLKEAGMVLLGKLSMSEFALGGPSAEFGPPCNNPWNLEYSPGGSSSGSGAAVAASLCAASLGSDTAGSIRSPASDCGIVGLKPSSGRVSRGGVVPLSWTLDSVGPMTKTIEDAALILSVIAGGESVDSTLSRMPVPNYLRELTEDLNHLTVGIPGEDLFQTCDGEVAHYIRGAIKLLERSGTTVRVVSPPSYALGKACAYAILHCEAATIHQRTLSRTPQLYGRRLRVLLKAAEKIPATTYVKALRVRRFLMGEFNQLFKGIDVLVAPTKTMTASRSSDRNSMQAHRRGGMFTGVFNVVGYPAISVPCGITSKGLPVGMQIVGRPFEESTVFKVALAYESRTDWHKMHPRI